MTIILKFEKGVAIISSVVITVGIITRNFYMILFGTFLAIVVMIEDKKYEKPTKG